MLFNSLEFLLFLPIVFAGYWLIYYAGVGEQPVRWRLWLQNLFVVGASYVFYGWWDWRFLILMSITALWSFFSGVWMDRLPERGRGAKALLTVALVVNLGILGFFKYFNFFEDQAILLLNAMGFQAHPWSLKIILPVGISFYTFQALSYVIDVYRRDLKPTRDPIAFLAFVSFFPQLVAGPIERATNLLPQFQKPRVFDYALAVEGCRQMLWGFFKKVLVADTCAVAANTILENPNPSSVSLWAGMIAFTFQIYGDFSGYSDIAIGCAKLFGIRLMRNFAYPYFARDIAEFWRRWHMSLTTWFRDYLYIPLGGSRCGAAKKIRNTFVIFMVSGFWHGANWTFIAWGLFHAVCFLPLLLLGKNRKYTSDIVAEGRWYPSFGELWRMGLTFLLAVVGWTFFRAPSIGTAFSWLKDMLIPLNLQVEQLGLGCFARAVSYIGLMLVIEWMSRTSALPLVPWPRWIRWMLYVIVVLWMVFFYPESQTFIYFQF